MLNALYVIAFLFVELHFLTKGAFTCLMVHTHVNWFYSLKYGIFFKRVSTARSFQPIKFSDPSLRAQAISPLSKVHRKISLQEIKTNQLRSESENYSHRNVFVRRKLGVCVLCVGFALCSFSGSLFTLLDAVFKRDIAALQTCERMLIRKQRCTSIGCSDLKTGTPCTLLFRKPNDHVSEALFFCQKFSASPAVPYALLLIWRE